MYALILYFVATCKRPFGPLLLNKMNNFVAGNRRHFKFGMWVEHCKSQPTDGKPSLKWVWSLPRDLINFSKISDNISKTVQIASWFLLNSNMKLYAHYRMVKV